MIIKRKTFVFSSKKVGKTIIITININFLKFLMQLSCEFLKCIYLRNTIPYTMTLKFTLV